MKSQMESTDQSRIAKTLGSCIERNTRSNEIASDSQHSQEISEMEFGTPSNDILIEILSRVPIKSLARFKCVSKVWNNMICDPVFRKLHRQNSKAVISGFFFQLQDGYEFSCPAKYVSINDDQVLVQHTILNFLPENVYILASNNGLLCCSNWGNRYWEFEKAVYVCNPATKKYVKLEGPKGWTVGTGVIQGLGFFSNPFSYSMDDSSNFTLVWISKKGRHESYSFHIYSSEIGEWRKSDEVCDCFSLIYGDSHSIFASGVLYWMTNQDEIVGFDVAKEKSMLIGSPFSTLQKFHSNCHKCIGESEGQLQCVFICDGDLKIWSLNCELKWVNKLSMSLASMWDEHPIFLYNDTNIMAYRKDLQSCIEPLAFNDENFLLKFSCSFSDEKQILRDVKFYLYNHFNRTLEEICTLDELGLFSGHDKWELGHGCLSSTSHSMRA